MNFIFTALLRDKQLDPEDQDYEFPVCFIIEASNENKALSWGNDVTFEHCINNPEHELVNTVVESSGNYPLHVLDTLPKIKFGFMPTGEYIGW